MSVCQPDDKAASKAPESGEHVVMLIVGEEVTRFAWARGLPARDFGSKLAEVVRKMTGQQTLQGLDLMAKVVVDPGLPAQSRKVTPRDLFEGRITQGGAVRIVKSQETAGVARAVSVASPLAPAANNGQSLLQPPQRMSSAHALGSNAAAAPRFQKRGGSQFQFMKIMQMDKDPAGLAGKSRTRRIPMEEVRQHASVGDTWMVLQGRVFNVTPYMDYHPGGKAELMRAAGADGTSLFNEIHPWISLDMIEKLQVGLLGPSVPSTSSTTPAAPGQAADAVALHPDHWRSFPVTDVQQLTADCLLLKLNLGAGKVSGLKSGQHVNVRITERHQGKTFSIERRYTPISDPQGKGPLELLVKVYPDGKMGQAISNLQPNSSSLELQGPLGDLIYLGGGQFSIRNGKPEKVHHVVMLAAGSGITPMLQLLRSMIPEWRSGTGPLVTLVSCNRHEEQIIFREDLERLTRDFGPKHLRLRLLLSQPKAGWQKAQDAVPKFSGHLTELMLVEALVGAEEDSVPLALSCGPEPFNEAVTGLLNQLGHPKDRMYIF